MQSLIPAVLVPAALLLGACVPDGDSARTGGEIVLPDGALAFATDCAACHGPAARGDGPLAATLSQHPPDLTQLSARAGGSFPRDYVYATIDGFDRGAHFAPDMPAFGGGDLGPTIIVEGADGAATPVPARLLALADYLQTLQTVP